MGKNRAERIAEREGRLGGPLTEAEKTKVIKTAGPHRVIQWYFDRFDKHDRKNQHGHLRATGARIMSMSEAKRLGE